MIGAGGAYIVAHENRNEAREARFANRVRELALLVMDEMIGLGFDLMQQVSFRSLGAQPSDPTKMPRVRNTIALRRALLELDLIARSQDVSDSGDELAKLLDELMGEFGYMSPRDDVAILQARPLPFATREAVQTRLGEIDGPYKRFQNAIRRDLGLGPLALPEIARRDQAPPSPGAGVDHDSASPTS